MFVNAYYVHVRHRQNTVRVVSIYRRPGPRQSTAQRRCWDWRVSLWNFVHHSTLFADLDRDAVCGIRILKFKCIPKQVLTYDDMFNGVWKIAHATFPGRSFPGYVSNVDKNWGLYSTVHNDADFSKQSLGRGRDEFKYNYDGWNLRLDTTAKVVIP